MPNPLPPRSASPFLVAICAWLIPGAGYFLLGERKRAITICSAIVCLFLLGIIVGGIRIMDPPGWGQYGYMTELIERYGGPRGGLYITHLEPTSQTEADLSQTDHNGFVGYALTSDFISQISDKPWYVGQILSGPITLAASAVSVREARSLPQTDSSPARPGVGVSHSRSWEIGALYTAVAGMLNLLAIIDSTYHASVSPNPADKGLPT